MQAPENGSPVRSGPLAFLLAVIFFVSPLLFFTDLTRNPYYFQITLLNMAVLCAAALYIYSSLKTGRWLLPRTQLDKPLAALLAVYAASFCCSLLFHAAFFRPSIFSEGLRTGMFFLVNCVLVYYLSSAVPFAGDGDEVPAGKWLAFILIWGGLWFLFPWLKVQPAGNGWFDKMVDPYGGLLWTAGLTSVWLLIRRARQEDILHLALSVGALASLYGVVEYYHVEFIWAKLINPYGNRSVSTFGNPNFVSSFVVVLLPLAVRYLISARTTVKRCYYGLVVLSYGGMLMASLTRSSWLGAGAALAFFAFFAQGIKVPAGNRKFLLSFSAAALILLFAWPSASLKPFSSGLVDRVAEVSSNLNTAASLKLTGDSGKLYSSFHQRMLIWTSAWQMGLENPLLGKGWGEFELFYPFYQGRLLFNFPEVRSLRTHANNAHNEILEQWSQAGLIGLGVYLWLLATLFYCFWRFWRSAPEAAADAAPLAAGIFGMLVDNMLNVSLHFAVPALAFWWLAGALMLKLRGRAGRPGERPLWTKPHQAAAAAWLLLICCLGGGWYWQRQFVRELRYFDGFKAMRSNNYVAAAVELHSAWEAHPREVNNNYELGNAYVRSGDLEKGAWAYSEALKANAGYDEIYFNLAIIQKRLDRREEALKNLQISSFVNPLNLTTWQAMAELYLARPAPEAAAPAAAAEFREAAAAFPYDGNTWNTLGYFYTLAKDLKSARDAYAHGVRVAPENKMLVGNLAGVVSKLGLRSDPDLEWLAKYAELDALAASYTDATPPAAVEPGIKAIDKLLAGEPDNLKMLMLRAKFYLRAGRLDEAMMDLKAVLARNYSDNQARYGLAVVSERKGDIAGARAEWERFLQMEPGNAQAAARLERLKSMQ